MTGVDVFTTAYGPVIAVRQHVAGDPERAAALDRDLLDLTRRHDEGGGAMHWEYLLLTGHRG